MDRQDNGQEGDVSFLPAFANEKNRELDVEIRELQATLEATVLESQEHHDRIQVMLDHLKNVQQELGFTQSRVESKNRELETEKHIKTLTERAAGKFREDLIHMEKQRRELEEKSLALQAQLLRGSERLDRFREEMHLNKEELEQWAIANRQKEDDNAALEKYKRQDDARVKDLVLAVEKVAADVQRRKQDLANEVTETQATQIQLDRAAEEFRKLAAERSALVQQYDQACEQMARRDHSIQLKAEQFAQQRAELRQKQAALDRQAAALERVVATNKELEERISRAERAAVKLRDTAAAENGGMQGLLDDVEATKNGVAKAKSTLSSLQRQAEAARADQASKERKLEAARARLEQAYAKLEEGRNKLQTLEERTAEIERLQQEEDRRVQAAARELAEMKDKLVKQGQELAQQRRREADLIAEISGAQGQNKALASKLAQLDERVVKQQENLYAVEYQEVIMRRKVDRAQGHRSEDEKVALQARIEELQRQLEDAQTEVGMLAQSARRAEEDLKAARKRSDDAQRESAALEADLRTCALECDSATRAARASAKLKEDKMVAHDLLALDARRVREALNSRVDEVFTLENRKLQLQLTVEERRHEVEVHREVLRAQLKGAQEEVHRVTLELRERAARVDRLQSKYDILAARMRPADGEQHSQAYYIIKAAQEREELQRTGDALDAAIQQAEKEVKALEVALVRLGVKNDQFRSSLAPAGDPGRLAERDELRDRLDRAYDAMKFRRGEEQALAADEQQAGAKLANLQAEEAALRRATDDLSRRAAVAEREAAEQAAKLDRAQKKVQRLARANERAPQQEFALAELREVNRAALQELRALLTVGHEGIADALTQAGLSLAPTQSDAGSVAGSRAASRAGSVQGSVRSSGGLSAASRGSARQAVAVQPRSFGFGQ